MDVDSQEGNNNSNNSKYVCTVQPQRDLVSNWSVDLAKSLEDYLLKICSGEITGDSEHDNVNFAEAALLLQGSIQVYSRKVEYLYNLVLHALEFISQTRSQDHAEGTAAQPEASSSRAARDEDDQIWVFDDIPVDPKSCLDKSTSKEDSPDQLIKPPANLVVLEGECLDSTGDGELESYLLATNNLYRDFILLDPCDALAVDEFIKRDKSGEGQYGGYKGSSLISKAHKSFMSPVGRHSGGTAHKSSCKKGQDNIGHASPIGGAVQHNDFDYEPGPSNYGIPDNGFESDDHSLQDEQFDDSESDNDDPWKPLNPHEPGNLKVKPFKKEKMSRRFRVRKRTNIARQFPLAKLHGTINPELTEICEKLRACRRQESQPPPPYEKLRQTLVNGKIASHDTAVPPDNCDDENASDDGINDFEQPDFEMPDVNDMDGVNFEPHKLDDYADDHDMGDADVFEDPNSQASLEDLCRAHLDSLLASIKENEKQTELASRVSTWKQRIEHDLEEEDSRPAFDIHEYGEAILDKISEEEDDAILSFTDVVNGQEKHDIARSFSALLQLVNDRKVDLERNSAAGDSVCYTAVNPFHVRLLNHDRGPQKMTFQPSKKQRKSSLKRRCNNGEMDPPHRQSSVLSSPPSGSRSTPLLRQPNCKLFTQLGKPGGQKYTPEGKRRRKTRLVEPLDLNIAR